MRKNSSEFVTSFVSEAGTFRVNKDYFAYAEMDDLACWIAADGVDSDEEKESAEIAVKSIFSEVMAQPEISRRKLKKYLKNAHKALKAESRSVRLKASLVVMVTDYSKMIWAASGNARLYHFRNRRLDFKSKDQSIAQLMKESGKISEDDMNEHVERNNLTNYLGTVKKFKPYVSRKFYLNDGDAVLLCTAGFWENVDNVKIVDELKEAEDAAGLVDRMEEIILAKQNTLLNNYTVAAVFVNKVFKDNAESRAKFWIKAAKIAAVVIVILAVIATAGLVAGKKIIAMKDYEIRLLQLRATVEENEAAGDQFVKDGEYVQAYKAYGDAIEGLKSFKEQDREGEKVERIQGKYDTTKRIVDADDDFANKRYQTALTGYTQADADALPNYTRKKLLERIEKAKGYIAVLNLVELGDGLFEQNQYAEAREKYTQAKAIADKVSFEEMKGVLDAKTATVLTKSQDEEDRKKKLDSANRYERQAQQKYNAKSYKEAMDFYTMAKTLYQGLEMTDEVMALQLKIQDCQKREQDARDQKTAAERYQQRLAEGKLYERQGDDKFKSEKYSEAWELFKSAKDIYIEIDATEDIARIEPKIQEADDKRKFLYFFNR